MAREPASLKEGSVHRRQGLLSHLEDTDQSPVCSSETQTSKRAAQYQEIPSPEETAIKDALTLGRDLIRCY